MTNPRKPAIARTTNHPADTIPDRPADPPSGSNRQPKNEATTERLTEQHNVRIRPSVKDRLSRAVDKLRYETGDRSISIASITDNAIDAYLKKHDS